MTDEDVKLMPRQSKERLLGFLLLIAIAAIFLPMLMDGEGVRQGQLQAIIPDRPEIGEIVHYQPQYLAHDDSSELAPVVAASGSESIPLRPAPAPISEAKIAPKQLAPKAPPAKSSSKSPTKTSTKATPTSKPAAVKSRLAADKPRLDQQGVPAGWTLQLASFKERTNAVALQQKLKQQGYKAYIRDKGDLSKVFVGPDLQKSVIEGFKRELKRKFKLDGLILRFHP